MGHRFAKVGALLAFVLANIGGVLVQGDSVPEIRVQLGQGYEEVERTSSVSVQFRGSGGLMQFHALTPHRFVYTHPQLGFVLPEAKGVSMAARAGRIEQIDVNPQLTFLVLDDAIARSRQVIDLLDKKGWKRDTRPFKNLYSGDALKGYASLDNIRDAFLDPHLDNTLSRVLIASWKNDMQEAEVVLARKRLQEPPPTDRLGEAKYLVSLTLAYPTGHRPK